MTVCCGPSGSGKSSLAIDTIYAEGQRRYVESLSSYARQFLGQMQKPKVEHDQRPVAGHQHRAEDDQQEPALDRRHRHRDLRLPAHPLRPARPAVLPGCDIADRHADGRRDRREDPAPARGDEALRHGPARAARTGEVRRRSGTSSARSGFARVRVDGKSLQPRRAARASTTAASTRSRSSSTARSCAPDHAVAAGRRGRGGARPGQGRACTSPTSTTSADEPKWQVDRYSQHSPCDHCGRSFEPLNPHHFSFNSPLGWCPACEGLGIQHGANPAVLIPDGRREPPRGGGRRLARLRRRTRCSPG